MPSASTMFAAYSAMRDRQEAIAAKPISMDRQQREAAARRAEEAREKLAALGPLVAEEAERGAAEAQGYDGKEAA